MSVYERDIVAWSIEQASLLRAGRFASLDIEHIAEEIEDVGKSEQRELASRMAVLLTHLLKWRHQPARRGASWKRTIETQRKQIARAVQKTPSLKRTLDSAEWLEGVWDDAIDATVSETGVDLFTGACPWAIDTILSPLFFPDSVE